MELLPRKFASVAAAVILAGCAARTVPEPVLPVYAERDVQVQTIPRGGWIEVDGGYVGRAPAWVRVPVYSSGWPRDLVRIRATDMVSGAWEEKRFYGRPMPDKVLFDLRSWIRPE